MSSKITLDNITIKNSQSNFLDPINLQITFSNLTPLSHPIQWKIIYFGSANAQDHDQILEQFQIPPVQQVNTMKFEISVPAPDFKKIPRQQLLCVTAMILTVSYKNQQFIRVGYYIHYQYTGQEMFQNLSQLPVNFIVKNTKRTILYDKPRVTKFNIKWDSNQTQLSESQQQGKDSQIDQKNMDQQSQCKDINQEKQSTIQEKEQRSNNFSQSQAIQCQNN